MSLQPLLASSPESADTGVVIVFLIMGMIKIRIKAGWKDCLFAGRIIPALGGLKRLIIIFVICRN